MKTNLVALENKLTPNATTLYFITIFQFQFLLGQNGMRRE
jgi:hypothetical protein